MTAKIINLQDFKKKQKPVTDYGTKELPNQEQLMRFKVKGDSMNPILSDNQEIIADCLLPEIQPVEDFKGKIVIASIGGNCTIRKFDADKNNYYLHPENINYQTIKIERNSKDFRIIGVVVKILPAV
jgi:SOS-response transcriptional repressor LexA